jgi:hypothetical protein
MVWTVMVALRQWNRVKDSLAAHPDDTLVIEGYPFVDHDHHMLMAQSCISVAMQRARREAQSAEAPQEGRGEAG